MTEHKHTSYRLPESTRAKLQDLADLDGVTNAQVLNNLIQAEHRYRRDDIERHKATKKQAANTGK